MPTRFFVANCTQCKSLQTLGGGVGGKGGGGGEWGGVSRMVGLPWVSQVTTSGPGKTQELAYRHLVSSAGSGWEDEEGQASVAESEDNLSALFYTLPAAHPLSLWSICFKILFLRLPNGRPGLPKSLSILSS